MRFYTFLASIHNWLFNVEEENCAHMALLLEEWVHFYRTLAFRKQWFCICVHPVMYQIIEILYMYVCSLILVFLC